MKRFGVYKRLPGERFRAVQPWLRWIPERFLGYMSPKKLGEVELSLPGSRVAGEVWAAPPGLQKAIPFPRGLRALEVVGVEGFDQLDPAGGKPFVTNGDALELLYFLRWLRFRERKQGRRLSEMKVAVGGSGAGRVSTLARLLAGEVGEMVLIGREPYLKRVAGQIIAETGLAVRTRPVLPSEPADLVVWCGPSCPARERCVRLFHPDGRRTLTPGFSWKIGNSSTAAGQEIASFAAAEALLLAVGGWDDGLVSLPLNMRWVGHVRRLVRETGFWPSREELDTPGTVGYNVNNF